MMKFRERGLRTLGASLLAVLGLMGLGAGGAQAGWLIEGVAFHGTESLDVEDHVDALSSIPGKNLEIQCRTTSDENVIIKELTLIQGTLVLSECETFQMSPLVRVKNCDYINQPIKWGFKGHLILHNGQNYLLLEPPSGQGGAFTTVEFSEVCPLTETSELTGSLVLECGHLNGSGAFVGLDCGSSQVTQLLREAPNQTLFGDGIFLGENLSKRHGILSMKLAGPNIGKKWAGHV